MTTLTGKVFRGALYMDSGSEFLNALAPFEGKAVEVTVRAAQPPSQSKEHVHEAYRDGVLEGEVRCSSSECVLPEEG